MTSKAMSEYEKRAYAKLTASPDDSRSLVPLWAREKAAQLGASVRSGVSKIPGNEAVAAAYTKAATGLMDFTSGNGVKSVSLKGSIKRHQQAGHDVESGDDFRRLDLRSCDELLPRRKRVHEISAIAEGAASSLLITGATVSSTVSGGATAAVVVGTVAADSVVVLAGIGRIVGEVAITYGYDPTLPEEEVFAAQVIGLGMAVGSGAKTAALASLSRLTQDMMRRATWTRLNQHVLVEIVNRAFGSLGLKLTQKKLAQIVPVAGVVISAGVNLQLVQRMHAAAMHAYRLRFLTEKYDLDGSNSFDEELFATSRDEQEDVLDVEVMLADAVEENRASIEEPRSQPQSHSIERTPSDTSETEQS